MSVTAEGACLFLPGEIGIIMSLRPHQDLPLDLQLRSLLHQWARKLVNSDAAADRVVQRTINVICDDPDLLDGGAQMNEALFAFLRRYAFDENDIRGSREAKATYMDEFGGALDEDITKPR